MKALKISDIATICQGQVLRLATDYELQTLLTDSRKVFDAQAAAFFAIKGSNHDGHEHIAEVLKQGIRTVVIESNELTVPKAANVIKVDNCIMALQRLARHKRLAFEKPVIGITGSNGKTIVKEWLSKMLATRHAVVKSPRSYNSQLGVPLSVWELTETHDLAVFEAGISKEGEMVKLQRIIRPDMGILTNIGTAHEEGFRSIKAKLQEKISLFAKSQVLIYHSDDELIREEVDKLPQNVRRLSWAFEAKAKIRIRPLNDRHYRFDDKGKSFRLRLPYTDAASLENLIHCICCLRCLHWPVADIQAALNLLEPIDMRLKLNRGINRSYVIDDTYNNDLAGLETALDFLTHQKQFEKKTLILSDFLQVSNEKALYKSVDQMLSEKGLHQLIAIGPKLQAHQSLFKTPAQFFPDTDSSLKSLPELSLEGGW